MFKNAGQTDIDFHKCVTRVKRRLFRKKTTTKCEKLVQSIKSYNGNFISVHTEQSTNSDKICGLF